MKKYVELEQENADLKHENHEMRNFIQLLYLMSLENYNDDEVLAKVHNELHNFVKGA